MSRLGIIAGGGGLPQKLVAACRRDYKPFFVLAIKGQADEFTVKDAPHAWVKLGATNESVKILKENGVDILVMAGSIRRPSLADMKPDFRTISFFMRMGKKAFGDDALLRGVAEELEKDGFVLVGAHEVDPTLITPEGVLGKHVPDEGQQRDIAIGIHLTRTLGQMDVGQAAVVQQGIALGLEAVEGTDALLERCRHLRRKGQGGVLVKSCKPQQDRRLDLPAVGLTTVKKAYQAGLSGIAVEAGASFLLDREEVIETADKLGLFIMGFKNV
jgi:DUF1009 family protein